MHHKSQGSNLLLLINNESRVMRLISSVVLSIYYFMITFTGLLEKVMQHIKTEALQIRLTTYASSAFSLVR